MAKEEAAVADEDKAAADAEVTDEDKKTVDAGEGAAESEKGAEKEPEKEPETDPDESLPEETRKWIAERKAAEKKGKTEPESKEGDGDGEPADKAADKASDKPPGLDARLTHAAERAGLKAEEIEKLGDAAGAVLGKLADSYDSISTTYAELGKKPADATAEKAGKKPPEGAEVEGQQETGTPQPFDFEKPFKFDLDQKVKDDEGEEWTARDLFKGSTEQVLMKPMESAINAIREMVFSLHRDRDAQLGAQLEEKVNGFFKGIETDYGDLYGKGAMDSLEEGSDALKLRKELLAMAEEMAQGAVSKGHSLPPEEFLQRALFIHAKDKQATIQRRKVAEEVKKRSGQRVARPTSRTTADKTKGGTERATAAAAEKLEEIGLHGSEG